MTNLTQFKREKKQKRSLKDSADREKSFFYPRHGLYSRREHELLDSIYADDTLDLNAQREKMMEVKEVDDFWPQNKEELLVPQNSKVSFFTKATWFATGVAVSSFLWLIYFQISVHSTNINPDTKIVFQNAPSIVTDKTADKKLTEGLNESSTTGFKIPFISEFFKPKKEEVKEIALNEPEVVVEEEVNEEINNEEQTKESIEERVELAIAEEKPATIEVAQPTFHTIKNGDSLWIIARDYYGDPSPSNIKKIMDANSLRRAGSLKPGNKLVIPPING